VRKGGLYPTKPSRRGHGWAFCAVNGDRVKARGNGEGWGLLTSIAIKPLRVRKSVAKDLRTIVLGEVGGGRRERDKRTILKNDNGDYRFLMRQSAQKKM